MPPSHDPLVDPDPDEPALADFDGPDDDGLVPAPEAASATVRVPQADGEIRITFTGGDPVTYPVVDHLVTVPADQAGRFVAVVSGSELVGGSPSDAQEEQP